MRGEREVGDLVGHGDVGLLARGQRGEGKCNGGKRDGGDGETGEAGEKGRWGRVRVGAGRGEKNRSARGGGVGGTEGAGRQGGRGEESWRRHFGMRRWGEGSVSVARRSRGWRERRLGRFVRCPTSGGGGFEEGC